MLFGLHKERRRRHREKGMNLPVQFSLYFPSQPESASSPFTAQLADLSEHGMCLLTDFICYKDLHILLPSMFTSEQCRLKIKILDDDKSFTVHGKAVWYDRNTKDAPFIFRAGIEFLDLTADLKKQIHFLMKNGISESTRSAA